MSEVALLTVADFEAAAPRFASHQAIEFLDGGAGYGSTLRENVSAFERIRLWPRVLRDVSKIDVSIDLFGRRLSSPILLAPTGYHKVFHPEGELAVVRAANEAGSLLIAANFATTSIEDMARASTRPLWFQLYINPDRTSTERVIRAAVDSGCEAIVVTVDFPVNGPRDRELRAGFKLPEGVIRENLRHLGVDLAGAPHRPVATEVYNFIRASDATWEDIERLRASVKVPVLLKGILHPDDAIEAVRRGVDGIVVSNHGGRSLDTAPATMEVLPRIVSAVGGRIPVLVDGGVRRGVDVLKALCLGAKAVMVGRPYCWGLCVGGEQGVARVLQILDVETRMAMGLIGASNLRELGPESLYSCSGAGSHQVT
jgi:4-hydroxymandelate oxidase